MQYAIEQLLEGVDVSEWFVAAREHWERVLKEGEEFNPKAIAAHASAEQPWFEQNCGGRDIGQEIMVWAGICRYYKTSIGFGDDLEKAKAMLKGLRSSMCSSEIHFWADDVAKAYSEFGEDEV